MKTVVLCGVLLALVLVSSAQDKKPMLLGADDVDKEHAEMEKEETEVPQDINEIKKKAKQDRMHLKEMHTRARALKHQMEDKSLSKNAKHDLKKQFRALKTSMHSIKAELGHLKSMKKQLAKNKKHKGKRNGMKKGGHKGHRRNKLPLIETEEAKTEVVLKNDKPVLDFVSKEKVVEQVQKEENSLVNKQMDTLSKEERKAKRKLARKERRKEKKNGNKDNGPKLRTGLDNIDLPPQKKHKRGHKHHGNARPRCTTDDDCHGGAKCIANRKGKKHCRGNGMDKPAGKKCHESEQCARGLKCFVSKDQPENKHHNKHGICADPLTTDTTSGEFLPFKNKN